MKSVWCLFLQGPEFGTDLRSIHFSKDGAARALDAVRGYPPIHGDRKWIFGVSDAYVQEWPLDD